MAYPTNIDPLTPDPTPTSPRNNPSLAGKIVSLDQVAVALQTKVGTDSSADTSSLDYKVTANAAAAAAAQSTANTANSTANTALAATVTNAANIVTTAGLLTASGVPAGGTGVNGNLYLDTATGIIYRKTAGVWAAIYTPATGGTGGADLAWSVGVTTIPRASATNGSTSIGAGTVVWTGFVPQKSFTAANINIATLSSTAPSSAFVGLYSIAANGDGTRIALSATTTAIGATGVHKIPLITPVALTAGNAYAVAILTVGAANTQPCASIASNPLAGMTTQPFLAAFLGGQTTLPASFLFSGVNQTTTPFYAEITV